MKYTRCHNNGNKPFSRPAFIRFQGLLTPCNNMNPLKMVIRLSSGFNIGKIGSIRESLPNTGAGKWIFLRRWYKTYFDKN